MALNLPPISARSPPGSNTPPHPPQSIEEGDSETGLGDLLSQEFDSAGVHDPALLQNYQSDSDSQEEGTVVLSEALHQWGTWKTCIRSRVIKDPFHIFNMFYFSVIHGLRVEFTRALRDAIFIPDAADKARIETWGLRQSPPKNWETLVRVSPQWVWRRCKRIIPPPEELYPLVAKVLQIFGHLKDAKTGLPLFNSAAWAALGKPMNTYLGMLPKVMPSWGKVRIVDGDSIRTASASGKGANPERNSSYVRYEVQVKVAQRVGQRNETHLATQVCYGRLEQILVCQLPNGKLWGGFSDQIRLLAVITPCSTEGKDATQEIVSFTRMATAIVTDVQIVSAVVGRIKTRGKWMIIDQSGGLVKPEFVPSAESEKQDLEENLEE
ncbi:hypothetical protein B0H11DRAFT_2244021 [Mycena galericulata]|nr:hypothetical protein B0H11DRAFT_2244021 [Mycena galericulata]